MERSLRTSRLAAATLALGLAASLLVALSPARAGAEIPYPDTERISGVSAVEAGIGVSKRLYGNGEADSVVLVRKDKFPDGLAAAGVAGEFNGPVLFSSSSSLDSATETELRRVLPKGKTVYLMGGKAALSDAVANKLSGDYTVRRADGTDRVHTAALAAIRYTRSGPNNTAILVRGYGSPGQDNTEGWVDAISCGGFAADTGTPILLTNNTVDEVHQHTLDALSQLNIRTVYICGGFGAVPKSQSDQLLKLGYSVNRYAGTTRIGTAVDIANRLWGKGGSTVGDDFILVNGWSDNFAYGIAASPLSASLSAPILLVNNNDPSSYVPGDCPNPPNVNHETLCYLDNRGSDRIGSLTVVGSTALVSDKVFAAAAEAGGLPKDTAPPSVPANVTATDTPEDDGTNIDVTWDASTDNTSGDITYTVYVREAADDAMTTDNSTKAGSVKNATSFTVSGRTAGTEYEVAVTATDQFGNTSKLSGSDTATPTDEVPAAPEAAPNVQNQPGPAVVVSWTSAPEDDVTKYVVERANPSTFTGCDESPFTVGGPQWEAVAEVPQSTDPSYQDGDVTPGESYCYRYHKVDSTSNASGNSPTASIEVFEASNDTTAPSGTPQFYAVDFDQEEGLVSSLEPASRTEKSQPRVEVVVPAGAFSTGETGHVLIYVDGTLRQDHTFEAAGGEQVVSVFVSLNSSENDSTVDLSAKLADSAGNVGANSSADWSLNFRQNYPTTPRIVSVDGRNVDPVNFPDSRLPIVGDPNPRVDPTPTIVVAGLSTGTTNAQRVTLFHNNVSAASICVQPEDASDTGGQVAFDDVQMLGDPGTPTDNLLVATLTSINGRCSGPNAGTTRTGDSNTAIYRFDSAAFGLLDTVPAPGAEDVFAFDGTDFSVTFNKPAASGSTLTLQRPDGSSSSTATLSSASSAITLERTGTLAPGEWQLLVDATAADAPGQTVDSVCADDVQNDVRCVRFLSGFVHDVYVSGAVSPDTSEPNLNDSDDPETPQTNEEDFDITLVVEQDAPTGRYSALVGSDKLGDVDHHAGSESRAGVRFANESAGFALITDGSANPIEWRYEQCVPDAPDDSNCDTPSTVADHPTTRRQSDGRLPSALSAVDTANLGLRQGSGTSFRLDGATGLTRRAYTYDVRYRPTTRSGCCETQFRTDSASIAAELPASGDSESPTALPIDQAALRPGWSVQYWLRNADNGNESRIAGDGTLRGLEAIQPVNGGGSSGAGKLEAGDSLFLTFNNNVTFTSVGTIGSADGGLKIYAIDESDSSSFRLIVPNFTASSGSSTASVSTTRQLRISFGSATTVGGQPVPQDVSNTDTLVGAGLNWFGLNWALDTNTGHAVLVPPDGQGKGNSLTF